MKDSKLALWLRTGSASELFLKCFALLYVWESVLHLVLYMCSRQFAWRIFSDPTPASLQFWLDCLYGPFGIAIFIVLIPAVKPKQGAE